MTQNQSQQSKRVRKRPAVPEEIVIPEDRGLVELTGAPETPTVTVSSDPPFADMAREARREWSGVPTMLSYRMDGRSRYALVELGSVDLGRLWTAWSGSDEGTVEEFLGAISRAIGTDYPRIFRRVETLSV